MIDVILTFLTTSVFNDATDFVLCTMSMYLSYLIFTLMSILKSETNIFSFGSEEWFDWVEHILTSTICIIGSIGFSTVTFIHSMTQSHPEEITESLSDVFMIFIVFAAILYMKRFVNIELSNSKELKNVAI